MGPGPISGEGTDMQEMGRGPISGEGTDMCLRPGVGLAAAIALLGLQAAGGAAAGSPQGDGQQRGPRRGGLEVPVEYYKLPNGLKVVLSPDTTSPTAVAEPVSCRTSQDWAIVCIHVPASETAWPLMKVR